MLAFLAALPASLKVIGGIIAGLATISTTVWGVIKWLDVKITPTEEQKKESIDVQVQADRERVKNGGRP